MTQKVVAVRLTSRVTAGAVTETDRQTFYANRTTSSVWRGVNLVRPERLDRFAKLVNAKLVSASSLDDIDDPRDGLLRNPRFEPDGSLALRLGGLDGSAAPREVNLMQQEVKPLLSDRGRLVAGESRTPRPSRARGRARADTRSPTVDCGVVKCVALTFDDGPGEHTAKLLDELRKADVPATFFVLGQHVRAYPTLIEQMVAEGHEVANHTYDHQELPKLSPAAQRSEVARGRAEIVQAGAPKPKLLRPPYGAYDKSTQGLGQPLVLWDVDTLDWQNRSKTKTTDRALSLVRPGSIVLAHDIHYSSMKAAPAS